MTPNEFSGSWPDMLRLSDEILDYWGIGHQVSVNLVKKGINNIDGRLAWVDGHSTKHVTINICPSMWRDASPLKQYFVLLHEHCHIKATGHGTVFVAVLEDLLRAFRVVAVYKNALYDRMPTTIFSIAKEELYN